MGGDTPVRELADHVAEGEDDAVDELCLLVKRQTSLSFPLVVLLRVLLQLLVGCYAAVSPSTDVVAGVIWEFSPC